MNEVGLRGTADVAGPRPFGFEVGGCGCAGGGLVEVECKVRLPYISKSRWQRCSFGQG